MHNKACCKWSDPNHVVLTTTDSNIWVGSSAHTYTFTHQPNGSTDIDVEVVREGKNFKGRLLALVLSTIGSSAPETALVNSVKAIEGRHEPTMESIAARADEPA